MPIDRLLRQTGVNWIASMAIVASSSLSVDAATVEVTVSGVTPNGSAVLATLCDGGLDEARCAHGQKQSATGTVLIFLFENVDPGRYAILAFQDSEGAGTLRRSRMGRPLDPYGLSNGAGRSRRPTFEQAAVPIGVTGARIAIRLDAPGSL